MQRRSFFKSLAAVAGYMGASKIAGAVSIPTIAPENLPVDNVISAGPPDTPEAEAYAAPVTEDLEGPFVVSVHGLRFIVQNYSMGIRYNSEFTFHMASGQVLKNRVAQSDGRFIAIGDHLEIPVLDHLVDTAAMWPELDPDDELNDELAGRARKANAWVVRLRRQLFSGSSEARIRAFHAASIGKATHYSDWPV